jgi:hypothetical protein
VWWNVRTVPSADVVSVTISGIYFALIGSVSILTSDRNALASKCFVPTDLNRRPVWNRMEEDFQIENRERLDITHGIDVGAGGDNKFMIP